jgi:hypothetical protein
MARFVVVVVVVVVSTEASFPAGRQAAPLPKIT